jgi:hypothetical protein
VTHRLLARLFAVGMAVAVGGSTANASIRTVQAALGFAADPTLDARRAAAVAATIARCMADRGWRYDPVVEPLPDIVDADLDPVAWAERWGLGVSTATRRPIPPPWTDPNLARMAAAPPGRRRAFLDDLVGRPGRDGCQPSAVDRVYGLRPRVLRPLREAFVALEREIAADPDLVAAEDAWSRCAPRIGGDAPRTRVGYAARAVTWFTDRLGASADATELVALRVHERRFAVSLARCDAAYAAARRLVAARHEAPFVARHRARLSALGAAIRRVEAGYPTEPVPPPP